MVEAVIAFALVSALFELILLLKFVRLHWLEKGWVVTLIHLVVFGLNLAIHFGTIVGTMTAITSALVSFATVPFARIIKRFKYHYDEQRS